MASICKNLVRVGVIAAIVGGAGAVIAGPDRIGAVFHQARSCINDKIDANITDPVALRAQLRDLQAQYPKRIGDVRGDLAQLKEQQSQLQRDLSVSNRVVELADGDIEKLTAALDQANAASVQNVALGVEHKIVIVFHNERIDTPTATSKMNQVSATRNAYFSRAKDIERDLGYLGQQERQLGTLLNKLETEQTSFQTQLFDLDRQIDAISRNDRMISIMSDRQRTLDEQSRYRASSLDQINSKLADLRAKQEAQLSSLSKIAEQFSYEDAAKQQLDRESTPTSPTRTPAKAPAAKVSPTVIEINPDTTPSPTKSAENNGPVASNSGGGY